MQTMLHGYHWVETKVFFYLKKKEVILVIGENLLKNGIVKGNDATTDYWQVADDLCT